MFAIEEDVDKKLWLYAIHMGKDRSEVVNDLLRPIVASMVLYDSRDRRGGRNTEAKPIVAADRASDWKKGTIPRAESRFTRRQVGFGEEQGLVGPDLA